MWVLVGPTASGKTEVGCRVAEASGAEVICADAMTIWRGLDVGTAKPDPAQRARAPHHLIDLVEPGARPTVATFAEAATEAIRVIRARGSRVLVAGGSGLYVRAVVDGLDLAPTDPVLRAELEALAPDEALRRLKEADPEAPGLVDTANRRRVVRALETVLLTGEPLAKRRPGWRRREDATVVGLRVSDGVLEERILTRIHAMLSAGWIQEAARFDAEGRRADVLATGAIGYAEVFAVLDGDLDEASAVDRIFRATRKLARRQMTWFRADPRVRWVLADDLDDATEAALRAYA